MVIISDGPAQYAFYVRNKNKKKKHVFMLKNKKENYFFCFYLPSFFAYLQEGIQKRNYNVYKVLKKFIFNDLIKNFLVCKSSKQVCKT